MTDIPEDVLKSARECAADTVHPGHVDVARTAYLWGGMDESHAVQAAARAITADRKRRVVVKPLEFNKYCVALGHCVSYSVYETGSGWNCVIYPVGEVHYRVAEGVSESEAYAAANADNERRILATLEFTDAPDRLAAAEADAERLAEALREIEAIRETIRAVLANDLSGPAEAAFWRGLDILDCARAALASHENRKGERHE